MNIKNLTIILPALIVAACGGGNSTKTDPVSNPVIDPSDPPISSPVLSSVEFFYIGEDFEQTEDDVVAPIAEFYTHSVSGENVASISGFEGNRFEFPEEEPEAYTASFETIVEDHVFINIFTSFFVGSEEKIYLDSSPIDYYTRDESEGCKELTFDASQLTGEINYGDDVEGVGVSGLSACDRSWSRSTSYNSISRTYPDYVGANDNILAVVEGRDGHTIGYTFLTSDDYLDNTRIYLESLLTEFIQVSIINPTSRSVVFDIWAINNDPLRSSFRIGGYQSEADQTTNMNVINLEADKYNSNVSWFQVGDSYDRFQWYFANIASETIPTEMDVKVATGAFTDIVINYGEQMDVVWLGEELDGYDSVNITIAGETLSGEHFRWEIYAPNTGAITIPYFPNIIQPDFSAGIDFNIRLHASNSEVYDYAALRAFVLLHCFEAQCEDIAYFE
ncbi:hypothetical protein [Saccharophagus degradans]|uniref:Lipoprotein n=1 Tax=Saccharophagus degradans (strain 2-40 / ATCC 43961 / DSM 17024) TaxID=203122 RepID=Q21DL6_SACD2|nr:hypothetical protein [Saccharophagus degradans]ABD83213.1 hypothetical protein Sde_3958 [Saccharophagus degradans 2-40]